jgi:epoxyqueuosine reductase QueG
MSSLDVLDVLNWTEDDRRKVFQGSAMKRAKLDMIRRNAVIVARNQLMKCEDVLLREKIISISKDEHESEIVRAAAR